MALKIIPVPKTIRSDLSGKTFGRLTVIGFHSRRGVQILWACKCSCGNEQVAEGGNLRRGYTASCGCYAREKSSINNFRHGKCFTATYKSWQAMKTRCTNRNDGHWPSYGGRGIKVCKRWLNDFNAFVSDMGERPKGATLGRIDNDGDYEPGNCRWESMKDQSNNTRGNHWIEYKGKQMTVEQLAANVGMNTHTLRSRLKHGMSINRAAEMPVQRKRA